MGLLKRLLIWRLKRQAANAYIRYHAAYDDLSCGRHLARAIRGSTEDDLAREFNRLLDRLAELGDDVPPNRLPVGDNE